MASADNLIKCFLNEQCKFNSEDNIIVKCCGPCGKLFHISWVNLKNVTAIELNNNIPGLTWHCVDGIKVISNKFMILDKIS